MKSIAFSRSPRPERAKDNSFATGSLPWQIEHLKCGESFLTEGGDETRRRACTRAIAKVIERQPQRNYDLSQWIATPRRGEGTVFRMLRLTRLE